MISNCSGDERGYIRGGKAGDNNGREWRLVNWYSYPWNVVLRYPNAKVRHWMGDQARAAALNDHIGYDQGERQGFWKQLKAVGYDASKITVNCETDCSAGVLAIAKAAGYHFGIKSLQNINEHGYTGNEQAILTQAGFTVLSDSKYLKSGDYLDNGDILLNTRNHTAFNVDAGSKCDTTVWSGKETTVSKPVIDVSVHNGTIDWAKAKTGIAGAIIRCGYGSDMKSQDDQLWQYNVTQCEKYGIPYGMYLYSYATNTQMAKSEAEHALRLAKGHKPAVIYFDSEEPNTKSVAKANAQTFIAEIRKAGYKAGLYASRSWYSSYLKGVSNDSLWLAAYGTNNGTAQDKYRPNMGEDLWQYTSVGHIPGSSHSTDMNIMYRNIFGSSGASSGSSGTSSNNSSVANTDLLELVARTQEGKYGNGDERVRNLGSKYQAVQEMINHIYNSSATALAKDVIAGMFGNGELRKRVLGSRYTEVQNAVNRMI